MKLDKEKALVVFSGGQDSSTCLFWALKHFKEVQAITFTYGQKHSLEVKMAAALAEKAGVSLALMDVPLIGQLGSNSLTRKSRKVRSPIHLFRGGTCFS